jgi:NTE family protein
MPRRRTYALPVFVLLSLLLLTAACSHAPLNTPLGKADGSESARLLAPQLSPSNESRLLVGLYFSGGGSRAAALAYGVLKELSQTPVPGGRMLDQVVAINAVSGGCFPCAYYCLYGDRVFTEFEPRFLDRNIQGELMRRCFGPRGLMRIASSTFARSDVAAEFYDEILFHGATFGDLAKEDRKRPFLVLHATDLGDCTPFQFTQDQFDLLGSDLSRFPISRAIAASSAFPVLLSPIVLRNYGPREDADRSLWRQPVASQSLFGLRQEAIHRHAEMYQDTAHHPYVHLVDGGLSDNLGLLSFIDIVAMKGGWGSMMESVRKAGYDRIALIVVDASIENEQPWELSPETPTTKMAVRAMSNSLVRRNNHFALENVQTCLRICMQERRVLRNPDEPEDPRVYFVSLGFADLADAAERERINKIETRLSIRHDDTQAVIRAASRLLHDSPEFQRLLRDLNKPSEVH